MHHTRKLPFAVAILALACSVPTAHPAGRIANLSSRVYCQTRDAVVVTEFIVYGQGNETFVLRGLGPSLQEFGIPDPLQDPNLRLLDVRGNRLDQNDNWMENPDKQEIIDVGLAPPNDLESATRAFTYQCGIARCAGRSQTRALRLDWRLDLH